jgi:hypothetical protein
VKLFNLNWFARFKTYNPLSAGFLIYGIRKTMHIITICRSTNQNAQKLTNAQLQSSCPRQCPKFNQCNAPVCPLDAEWEKRKYISGDKCCVYLLEASKVNAKRSFEGAGLSNMHAAIEVVKDDILTSSATIKRAYMRASSTPSRLQPKFMKVCKA